MEALVCCSLPSLTITKARNIVTRDCCSLTVRKTWDFGVKNARTTTKRRTRIGVVSVSDVTTVLDPAPVEITWQIVVGTIAGITPFVVAGIEFSKRIVSHFFYLIIAIS
ncbi:transmembrane protein, putative [Medicago truncatula]|uniref:Transmembrane protein, putative n=1 Tax=Medicago truncatula TaxID=3880 RepID=A0A072UFC6_MEDTR|nr:transmembrane protein, putative [Medicago truncatula]